MNRRLNDQQLVAWWLTVEQRLAVDGELTVVEDPDDPGYRRFELEAPGYDLPLEARFKYEEWWERRRSWWRVAAYVHHYADRVRGGDMGYHWHPLRGRSPVDEPVHHVACRRPGGQTEHYRWYSMTLLEAHETLFRRYAAGVPITCTGLHPLD